MTAGADTSDYAASTDSLEKAGDNGAAILTDTGTTLDGKIDTISALATAIDTLTKAAGDGDLAAILTDTGTTLDALVKYAIKIAGNKIAITDLTGATILYDDDSATPLKTCTIADNSTTTTRTILA
jgi:hypothetical protein